MRRIASLAILFVALVEFALEGTRFDLWIITAAAALLLWSILARTPRSPVQSQKHDHHVLTSKK